MHVYYIISMTTTGNEIFFIGAPFTEIYVVLIKMSGDKYSIILRI